MTYKEAALIYSLLPDEEAAKAIKATVFYFLDGVEPENLTGPAARVFDIMKKDIDRNNDKYQRIVSRNTKNIQKRWKKEV